jgi:hypothetical protein
MLWESFATGLAIPLLERLGGDLSLDQELRELASLRLAFEGHHASFFHLVGTTANAISAIAIRPSSEDSGCFVRLRAAPRALVAVDLLALNQRQRMLIADTLRQVANIIFAAGVVGRMFGSERGSLVISALGMAAWWVILAAAVAFAGGKGT